MRIGIFTALEEESRSFLQHAESCVQVGDFTVWKLDIGDVYLCRPPVVGEIAAAAACQLLISRFNVQAILNFGVVGALTEQTRTFSTMYVHSVVHYAKDTTGIDDCPLGQYECFPSVAVDTDGDLLKTALTVHKLPVVRCASADKFVADSGEKSMLNSLFGADICDMESAGVLFTCKFNGVPCLLIKCVSDSLYGGSGEYDENSDKAAQHFFALAEGLVKKLQGATSAG